MELAKINIEKTVDGYVGLIEFLGASTSEVQLALSSVMSYMQGDILPPMGPGEEYVVKKPTVKPDIIRCGVEYWLERPEWNSDGKVWLHVEELGWAEVDEKIIMQIPDISIIKRWSPDITRIIYKSKPYWNPADGYEWIATVAGWIMIQV